MEVPSDRAITTAPAEAEGADDLAATQRRTPQFDLYYGL